MTNKHPVSNHGSTLGWLDQSETISNYVKGAQVCSANQLNGTVHTCYQLCSKELVQRIASQKRGYLRRNGVGHWPSLLH